ncbi:MAG: hypothetical protein FD119_3519 [Stygiobacter sp.]|nr:MAG: hypothetical protein FD119_3519 [Stygiobacter sp.]
MQKLYSAAIYVTTIIVIFLCFSIFFSGDGFTLIYGDRDLWRGLHSFNEFYFLGPEYNAGPRSPGGFFYYLLGAAFFFQADISAAQFLMRVLFCGTALLLIWCGWRQEQRLGGGLAAIFFLSSGYLYRDALIWNPSYLPFFSAIAAVALAEFVRNGGRTPVFIMGLAISLGMQIHSSIAAFFPALAATLIVFRVPIRLCHIGWFVAGLALPLTHFFAAEVLSGFMYSSDILFNGDMAKAGNTGLLNRLGKFPTVMAEVAGGLSNTWGSMLAARLAGLDRLAILADAGTVGLLGLGGVFLIVRRFRTRPTIADIALVLGVAYVLAVVLGGGTYPRHYIGATPLIALALGAIAGVSFEMKPLRPVLRVAALGLAVASLALVFGRGTVVGLILQSQSNKDNRAAVMLQEVKQRYYGTLEEFSARIAILSRRDGAITRYTSNLQHDRLSFQFETLPPSDRHETGCTAVLFRDNNDAGGEAAVSEMLRAPILADQQPDMVEWWEKPGMVTVHYRTKFGNCISTQQNAYIPTTFERTYLEPRWSGRRDGVTWHVDGPMAIAVLHFAADPYPIGLRFRYQAGRLEAEIHGQPLRGFTYFSQRALKDVSLSLMAEDGRQVRLPTIDGVLGNDHVAMLTPWRTAGAVPPGRYRATLTATEEEALKSRFPQGPLIVELGDVVVGTDGVRAEPTGGLR